MANELCNLVAGYKLQYAIPGDKFKPLQGLPDPLAA